MKSFVTGSHAYGTPNENSDIDLVVFVDPNDTFKLIEHADSNNGCSNGSGGPDDVSLRFGKLNLIVLADEEKFHLWKEATDALIGLRPVSRERAVDWHRYKVDFELAERRRRVSEIEAQQEVQQAWNP